ncbi:MAG: hypothetical protein DHS20C18_25660 [Saprospiraceae bacterium]|nr:MAG: hypothetical protein DHS20C18_25660 [Saprospiraceae bacterium]
MKKRNLKLKALILFSLLIGLQQLGRAHCIYNYSGVTIKASVSPGDFTKTISHNDSECCNSTNSDCHPIEPRTTTQLYTATIEVGDVKITVPLEAGGFLEVYSVTEEPGREAMITCLSYGADGNLKTTRPFYTGSGNRSIKFLATGDPQYNNQVNENTIRSSIVLNTIQGRLNPVGAQYRGIIVSGDCTQNSRKDEYDTYKDLTKTYNNWIYDGIGNHDLFNPDWTEYTACPLLDYCQDPFMIFDDIKERKRSSSVNFSNVNGEIYKASLPAPFTSVSYDFHSFKPPHYSWDWEDVHFVQLNLYPGNGHGQADHDPDGDPYYLTPMNSLAFLEADLQSHVANSPDPCRPIVLIHHYGMDNFSIGDDDGDGNFGESGEREWWTAADRLAYWNAIADYNVAAIITGHNHTATDFYIPWSRPDGTTEGPNAIPTFIAGGAKDGGYFIEVEMNNSQLIATRFEQMGGALGIQFSQVDQEVVPLIDDCPPIALCKDATVALDNNGNGTLLPDDVDNGSHDDNGIVDWNLSQTDFDCSDVSPLKVTITLSVTDGTGQTATCQSRVLVRDSGDPTAICKDITVSLDEAGQARVASNDLDDGSYDACPGPISFFFPGDHIFQNFDCSNIGDNPVTVRVFDNYGNIGTCNPTVTVVDDMAPEAVCKNLTINVGSSGLISIAVYQIDDGSNDNCNIASYALSRTIFTCTDIGVNPITMTVTDVSGNNNPCNTFVTVEDNVPPEALCQDVTIQLDVNGEASVTAGQVDNGSDDVCGLESITLSQANFDCAEVGGNEVTLTATDGSGNPNTCTTTVTVEDNIAPEARCQDATIQLDVNGAASVTVNEVDDNSNDACGLASMALSQTSFDCAEVGGNEVILTATDVNGNQNTCTATVTVEDNVPPEALCQDVTIKLDANGAASVTASAVDNGSNDACGLASIALNQTNFVCSEVGDNEVILTATDVNSNINTCTAKVTVEDKVIPEALCQDVTIQLGANGAASVTAGQVDDGSNDACGLESMALNQTNFVCAEVGGNEVILTVTDVNSNTNTCTATVTVEDNVIPEISLCQGNALDFNGENELLSSSVIDFAATDACGLVSTIYDPEYITCDHLGMNIPVTVTTTDVNGNANSCIANVEVTGLPCGWEDYDDDGIGCEDSNDASYDVPSESFTLVSEGCYSTNFTADDAAYVKYDLCGDGEIIAHIASISPLGQGWAGISMRENEAPGSKKVALSTNLSNFCRREVRFSTNGSAYPQQFFRPGASWLKLVRNGNQFRGYLSTNGSSWQSAMAYNMNMSNCIQLGLYLTNYNSATVTAIFDQVSVTGAGNLAFSTPEVSLGEVGATYFDAKDFSIFPNPAKEQLYLNLDNYYGQEVQIVIINHLGQTLLQRKLDQVGTKPEKLDLNVLSNGTYFIKINTDKGQKVKQFLIAK